MFDFQKLHVYQKSKDFRNSIKHLIIRSNFDRTTRDQISRASMSIALNIAESASRFSLKDRRNFIVIARGSVFECVAILELLATNNEISKEEYEKFYSALEDISKMLFGLIKKLGKN